MKTIYHLATLALLVCLFAGCRQEKMQKGFAVQSTDEEETESGFNEKAPVAKLAIQPSNVLLTGNSDYRLTTLYKVNYNKKSERTFIGSNNYHQKYWDRAPNNRWNYHYMPGLEAVYGYNMLNVSLHNVATKATSNLFAQHVLIKTLYYPAFEQDTLNGVPVNRNYYFVSVYDEDTNGDSLINLRDLRRFYYFDLDGKNQRPLIPTNYSVTGAEYDSANDFMYVFAKEDANGRKDDDEQTHIFWIDLKDPASSGRLY